MSGLPDAPAPAPDSAVAITDTAPPPDAPVIGTDAPPPPADAPLIRDTAPVPDAPVAADTAVPDLPTPPADAPPPPPDAPGADHVDAFAGRPVGDGCNADGECALRLCVDHVCCATACAGTCMACASSKTGVANGTCAPVFDDSDPDNDCAQDAPMSCGQDGMCNGNGQCRRYGSATSCGPPTCAGSTYTEPRACTGQGFCAQATAHDCGRYLCALDGCLTSCGGDGDCVADAYCDGQSCLARKPVGAMCSRPRECALGLACPLGLCL
jgi:hypothetical protein